ncbi:MAG: peptidase domain-containing ABC transporter [Betaproteobacteria bacterium]
MIAGAVAPESRLGFGWRRRLALILQSEAVECGLACLAMVAGWHGYRTDLPTLRRRFSISLKGATLKQLIDIAGQLNLAARPLRLELDELAELKTPCILHWNLNHFVVLVRAGKRHIEILDPAHGERRLSLAEASPHFTGVALELSPTPAFKKKEDKQTIALGNLLGRVVGLKKSLVQILLLALALEVFALVSPFFMQWVVDGAIVSADRDLLLMLTLGFALLMLVQTAIGLARSWVVLFMATHLGLQWNANVLTHLLRLPAAWFEKRHMGDVVSRFGSVGAIQKTLTTSFVEAVIDGVMAVATLVMMLFYSVTLSAIVAASLLIYGLLRWAAYGPLRQATGEQIVLNAKASSLFMESIRAVTAIKLFNHEDERRARWMNATVDATNRGLATEKMMIGYKLAQTLLAGTENLLIVYLGALAVMDNSFSVGMLFAFVSYKSTFSGRVASLIDKWVQLKMLRLHGERLADIVLEAPEHKPEQEFSERALSDLTLEARNLSFRYGDAEPWVLRKLNITIQAGESVAIAGSSGCGKTTLLKILLGLLPPTEGEVRVGGVRIDQLGLRQYRKLIGAVMQEDQLLAGSIGENIAFFDVRPDQRRIEVCAQIAGVHDEIMAMPMGYATLIGDMGTAISGGQKQRVLLARALYKQPRLLFLDEATSHLDVNKESLVNAAIRNLRLTRVIVAHRPQTIASAERVIVLEAGQIRQDLRVTAAHGGLDRGAAVELRQQGAPCSG